MSVQPHPSSVRGAGPRAPWKGLGRRARRLSPSWRWLAEGVWWIEHGFERARAHGRPEEDSRVRIFLVLAVFGLVFAGLGVKAGYAALFEPVGASYRGAASDRSRADLVDRNGRLLATDVIFYALFIDPSQVWDRDVAYREIRRVLPRLNADRLKGAIWGDRQVIVASGLTPEERARVHDLGLGGVTFAMEDGRVYPLDGEARHLIGATDTGGQGISGAELAFDKELRAEGAAGAPFELSIDLRIQGVVENELATTMAQTNAKAGVAIVTNVQTGEVLAMASWPDRGSRNLATSGHYEMGSVFKSFAVAAGLDTGAADMTTLFDASEPFMIGKRRITDFHAQNRIMTLEEVYLHSSNIGTSRLAVQMGPDVMKDYFGRLGLLERAPLELVESAAPRVPGDWTPTTLASLSFGYGIMVTPVQVIAAVGALSNGGRYVPLSLRKGGALGAEPRPVVSPQTSLNMLDLMRRNVVRGSGGRANAAGLRVGGKTGSANKWTGSRYDPAVAVGTFIGVFPSDGPLDAPRYAILVLVDEPGSYPRTGGFVAAPAVGRIADRIAPFVGVERADDRWQLADGRPNPTLRDMEASL